MNIVLLLLIFAGIILVMANELLAARTEPKVTYRYLPRDLDTYLREEPYATVTFDSMFTGDDDFPVGR